jgi:hypothetical protein
MKRRWLRIELTEPVIISETNQTTGRHRCLDFIPGRMLLGIAASRLYAELDDKSWTAFHSGRVRFVDAVPLASNGGPTVPMPMALHAIKGGAAGRLYNLSHDSSERKDDVQYVQKRRGWIEFGADAAAREPWPATQTTVKRSSTTKTAIDPTSGNRAKESMLFDYEYIERGQVFVGRIDADDDICDELLERIEQALVGAGQIGRSRSAEFGRVDIRRANIEPTVAASAAKERIGVDSLAVLLTTDVSFVDSESGSPRLQPTASDFGLPEHWTFKPASSFVRTRAYDRFNGYRRAFDLRRQVLRRGSVLSFSGEPLLDSDIDSLKTRVERGTGVDRQEGLGQFQVDPPWSRHFEFDMHQASRQDESALLAGNEVPDPALAAFVRSRRPSFSPAERDDLQKHARSIADIYRDQDTLPSVSQWGRVRQWAKTTQRVDLDGFLKLIGGATGTLGKGWEASFEGATLGEWLVDYGKNEKHGPHLVSELAHLVREHLVHRDAPQEQNQQEQNQQETSQ